MTYLAICIKTSIVVAQFCDCADCDEFCRTRDFLLLPFNAARHPVPAVGCKYVA